MTLKKTDVNIKRKKAALLKAFENAVGNVSFACKSVKISRNQFYEYRKNDKKFDSECTEIEEGLIDHAESMLRKNINEGKETSIIFYLKTKAKARGYVERTEVEVTDMNISETTIFRVKRKSLDQFLKKNKETK